MFGVENGEYRHTNAFWTSHSIDELVAKAPEVERQRLARRIDVLAETYAKLSAGYQARKQRGGIPLA